VDPMAEERVPFYLRLPVLNGDGGTASIDDLKCWRMRDNSVWVDLTQVATSLGAGGGSISMKWCRWWSDWETDIIACWSAIGLSAFNSFRPSARAVRSRAQGGTKREYDVIDDFTHDVYTMRLDALLAFLAYLSLAYPRPWLRGQARILLQSLARFLLTARVPEGFQRVDELPAVARAQCGFREAGETCCCHLSDAWGDSDATGFQDMTDRICRLLGASLVCRSCAEIGGSFTQALATSMAASIEEASWTRNPFDIANALPEGRKKEAH